MEKILLPVDGSRSAKSAIDYAVSSQCAKRREIHLLNVQTAVTPNSVVLFPTVEMMAKARQSAGEEVLRPVRAMLEAHGIGYTAQVVLGDVAENIVRCAAERGCSSILMGTRGMSAMGNLMFGSVAARVVSRAEIPVTLIKRTSGAASELHAPHPGDVREEARMH
jgi:nucleotide-binding universal stress UspA family protein